MNSDSVKEVTLNDSNLVAFAKATPAASPNAQTV